MTKILFPIQFDATTFNVCKTSKFHWLIFAATNTLVMQHNLMNWMTISIIIRKIIQSKLYHGDLPTSMSCQELLDPQFCNERLVILCYMQYKVFLLVLFWWKLTKLLWKIIQKEIITGYLESNIWKYCFKNAKEDNFEI